MQPLGLALEISEGPEEIMPIVKERYDEAL
jgi:hypothetical protein